MLSRGEKISFFSFHGALLLLKVYKSKQGSEWARLLFKCIKPSADTDFSLSGGVGMWVWTYKVVVVTFLPLFT